MLAALLLLAVLPTPSPEPTVARLQFGAYARAYAASLETGGPAQTGSNVFGIVRGEYAIDARSWYAAATAYYSNADALSPSGSTSKLLESYLAYRHGAWSVTAGNQFFASPWADTHFKLGLIPTAYQGVVVRYRANGWSFDAARIDRFESRESSSFSQTTLAMTPGGAPAASPGFTYAHAGFAGANVAVDAYGYSMSNLVSMLWFTAHASFGTRGLQPYVTLQGGVERSAGASTLGAISSSVSGISAGVQTSPETAFSIALDAVPWRSQTLVLPRGVSCEDAGESPTYQLSGNVAALRTFLPQGVAQCARGTRGATTVYDGGWASPYSESYATDPLFTTELLEGLPDRQSPGSSAAGEFDYTSPDRRLTLSEIYVRFNYANAAAAQRTAEWDSVAAYRLGKVERNTYKGVLLRAGFIEQTKSNVSYAGGAPFLGGTPFTRYARMQVEYYL